MKSSSNLFPVALLSAEFKSGIYEDVYSLKPDNSPDTSVKIALVRLHRERRTPARPVLLVHDAFSNHWQWLDYGLGGVAGYLARQGLDVWLMDWRGHGLSSRNKEPGRNHLNEMARYDMPAVVDFIREKTGHDPAVVAQGYGCELVALALSGGVELAEITFVHPPALLPDRRFLIPGVKWLRRLTYSHRRWLHGPGEEPEPTVLFTQRLAQQGWLPKWGVQQTLTAKSCLQRHEAQLRWVLSGGGVPGWLRRLQVPEERILIGPVSNLDWSAVMPDTWATLAQPTQSAKDPTSV